MVYLLLNAVSYRPCAGHMLGFMSIGLVVAEIMTFFYKMRTVLLTDCKQLAYTAGRPWPRPVLLIVLLLIAQATSGTVDWLAACRAGVSAIQSFTKSSCSSRNSLYEIRMFAHTLTGGHILRYMCHMMRKNGWAPAGASDHSDGDSPIAAFLLMTHNVSARVKARAPSYKANAATHTRAKYFRTSKYIVQNPIQATICWHELLLL